jgi:hypothetical protein
MNKERGRELKKRAVECFDELVDIYKELVTEGDNLYRPYHMLELQNTFTTILNLRRDLKK